MRTKVELGVGVLGLALCMAGCASDDDSTVKSPKVHVDVEDPVGVYEDDAGFAHRVDSSAWVIESSVFTFVGFDSKLDQVVAKNAAENEYSPGKFSRFEWARDEDDKLRYCQTVYDADTEEEAASEPAADASDWEEGCGGNPWSILSGVEIVGTYEDDWGGGHVVDPQSWTMTGAVAAHYELLRLSNTDRYLVAQNAETNTYNPGKFSRFDWTFDAEGTLYYCQSKYDAETEADALSATPANAADLAQGCGSFAWSKLISSGD